MQAYWSRESTDVETAGSTEEDVIVVPDEVVLLTPEPATAPPEPTPDTAQRVVEEDVMVVKRRGVKTAGLTSYMRVSTFLCNLRANPA